MVLRIVLAVTVTVKMTDGDNLGNGNNNSFR